MGQVAPLGATRVNRMRLFMSARSPVKTLRFPKSTGAHTYPGTTMVDGNVAKERGGWGGGTNFLLALVIDHSPRIPLERGEGGGVYSMPCMAVVV